MTTPHTETSDRTLFRYVLLLALVGAIGTLAVATAYQRNAPALLARLDVSVGEQLMQRARALEEAGQEEAAEAMYRQALASRFEGAQNRAFVLKRLGVIRWMAGDLEEAATLLQEAATFAGAPLSLYGPLCDALYRLGAYTELDSAVAEWRAAAAKTDRSNALAEAAYYAGLSARTRGDDAAARQAFTDGLRHAPGGRNASELAIIFFEEGDYSQALEYADAYLASGGTGGRADKMRRLRTQAEEHLPETASQ